MQGTLVPFAARSGRRHQLHHLSNKVSVRVSALCCAGAEDWGGA